MGPALHQPQIKELLFEQVAEGGVQTRSNGVETLSDRELEVFRSLSTVRTARAMAEKLGISVKTVETHCQRIKLKLGVRTGDALKRRAAEWLSSDRTRGGWAESTFSKKGKKLSSKAEKLTPSCKGT